MPKPRLLIPISLQFSIRYLLRTGLLRQIAEFAEPVMLLAWQNSELEAELSEFGEVHVLKKATWGREYAKVRDYLSTWHQIRFASPSTPIRERRGNLDRSFSARVRRRAWLQLRRYVIRMPGKVDALQDAEKRLLWEDTNASEIDRQIQGLKPDAVFCLTPFLADEEMTVRVCASRGIPTCTSILSFDNLTTRSWIPIVFDQYMVWNSHNEQQLRRGYPEAGARPVAVVGSPQFDFYWDPTYIWEDRHWRNKLALPADRPIILFGGGYFSCAPHEPQFLQQLDDAIERGEIVREAIILFRRHPVDPITRWEPVLRKAKYIVHDDPWALGEKVLGHTNIKREDIQKLASTLYHCKVHVNVASTLSIDGAIFDRQQVGPAYDESPGRKYHRAAYECYMQEHFAPIAHSGGVDIVRSSQELIAQVQAGLTDSANGREGRKRLLREICTFDDGKSTGRVATVLAKFLESRFVRGESAGNAAVVSR
jgi:hypothetical protein